MKKFLIAFFLFQFIFIRAETLIDEVIVVGSYLKSTESDLSPINIINKDLIDDLNISSIAEISKYITSSSGSHFQANTLGGVDQGMASITLRGLDHASTLVLINSKRHTFAGTPSNQGEGYIDVNIIPEIAINRVEILKEGATSLYGSDAVAGVINFSLLRKFEGLNLDFSYQETDNYDQSESSLGMLYGWSSGKFNFVLGFNHLDRNPLSASEIPGIAELALSGLGKTFQVKEDAFVSSGPYSGNYSKDDLIPDPRCEINGGILSGGRCRFLYGNRFNIVNDETHNKLYSSITLESEKFDFNSTLIYSSVDVNDNPQSPSYPALPFLSRPIEANQAGNPFGVQVTWYGRPLGSEFASPHSPKDISQYHLSNEFIFELDASSTLEISLTNSMHSNDHKRPDIIDSRFLNAINGQGGSSGNEMWNIFDSQELSIDLINYVSGFEKSKKEASLDVLDLVYTRTLDDTEFALGLQYAEESLEIKYNEIARVEFDKDGKLLKTADLFFLGGGKNVDSSRSK
ncbi:MAG: TonB-dependent receptor plug domain-containing protein, partial [Gammaproteobacteria bacterium]